MDSLIEDLVSHVLPNPQKVETVFIGQSFTAVKLASDYVGLALTPQRHFDSCIGMSKLAGKFTEHNTSELAQFLVSGNSFLKAIGMAAINAVLQSELTQRSDHMEGDFVEFLNIKLGDKVATVDYYTTKISQLKKAKLTVFDDRFAGKKKKGIKILPLSSLPEKLPNADIVIFPPTFLDKIDDLKRLSSNAREFAVVHPSTPPLPEPFFKRGVTMVASMAVKDADSLFRYVMEGAGTTMFKRFCRKIVFVSKKA